MHMHKYFWQKIITKKIIHLGAVHISCEPNFTPSGSAPHVSQYEHFGDPHLPPPCIMRYMNGGKKSKKL